MTTETIEKEVTETKTEVKKEAPKKAQAKKASPKKAAKKAAPKKASPKKAADKKEETATVVYDNAFVKDSVKNVDKVNKLVETDYAEEASRVAKYLLEHGDYAFDESTNSSDFTVHDTVDTELLGEKYGEHAELLREFADEWLGNIVPQAGAMVAGALHAADPRSTKVQTNAKLLGIETATILSREDDADLAVITTANTFTGAKESFTAVEAAVQSLWASADEDSDSEE